MFSRPHNSVDFRFHHDVLCGVGGFATACEALSIRTVSAVDWTSLSSKSFCLNHTAPMLHADINSPATIYRMHELQQNMGC